MSKSKERRTASKEGVIYASGVHRRAEAILRAFCIKNNLTFAQLMNMMAHIIVERQDSVHDIKGRMITLSEKFGFSDEATYYNPTFEKFDQLVRDYMEEKTPEDYRKFPLIKRLFGNLYKPLTRQEIEKVERELAEEEEEERELPPVEDLE